MPTISKKKSLIRERVLRFLRERKGTGSTPVDYHMSVKIKTSRHKLIEIVTELACESKIVVDRIDSNRIYWVSLPERYFNLTLLNLNL